MVRASIYSTFANVILETQLTQMLKTIIIGSEKQCGEYQRQFIGIENIEIVGFFDPYHSYQKNSALNSIEIIELNTKAEAFITDSKTFLEFYEPLETLLKFGKDFIIDGFLKLDYHRLRKLESISQEGGSTIQVANIIRNKPLYSSASQLINEPRFIRFEKNTSNPEKGNFEDWLINNLSEELDAILRLTGANFKSAAARPLFLYSDTPDMLSIHIEFDNDAICQITAGSAVKNGKNQAKFFQQDRLIKVDFANSNLTEYRLKDNSMQLSMMSSDEKVKNEFMEVERPIMIFDSWKKEWRNFLECREKGLSPLTSINDCQNLQIVVENIMDKIYRKYQAV